LNEYLVKDFTMDDTRLKQVANIGSDYFDEMLERIRDIRSSKKRFYQCVSWAEARKPNRSSLKNAGLRSSGQPTAPTW
jgi:hypothetical protein